MLSFEVNLKLYDQLDILYYKAMQITNYSYELEPDSYHFIIKFLKALKKILGKNINWFLESDI
jgi:hypothetical protein